MVRIFKFLDINFFFIGVSPSMMLGSCGMPGNTAYFGLTRLCQPQAGEVVVVSGAAGAVGSIVGQIAKIYGCRVIGFAGSDDKVEWLKSIGFDAVYNYKKTGVAEALEEAAPTGVDCYFDNVGGAMSIAVIERMNHRGRVAVCGAISGYNQVTNITLNTPMYYVSKCLQNSVHYIIAIHYSIIKEFVYFRSRICIQYIVLDKKGNNMKKINVVILRLIKEIL